MPQSRARTTHCTTLTRTLRRSLTSGAAAFALVSLLIWTHRLPLYGVAWSRSDCLWVVRTSRRGDRALFRFDAYPCRGCHSQVMLGYVRH